MQMFGVEITPQQLRNVKKNERTLIHVELNGELFQKIKKETFI